MIVCLCWIRFCIVDFYHTHPTIGPAPESVTDAIFENTQKISQYQYAPLPEVQAETRVLQQYLGSV